MVTKTYINPTFLLTFLCDIRVSTDSSASSDSSGGSDSSNSSDCCDSCDKEKNGLKEIAATFFPQAVVTVVIVTVVTVVIGTVVKIAIVTIVKGTYLSRD